MHPAPQPEQAKAMNAYMDKGYRHVGPPRYLTSKTYVVTLRDDRGNRVDIHPKGTAEEHPAR